MRSNRLRLPPIFSTEQLTRLHAEALGVIERIGIKVTDGDLRDSLSRHSGVHFSQDRACIDRSLVDDMVDEHRRQMSGRAPTEPDGPAVPAYVEPGEAIWLAAGSHGRWWHDPDADRVRPVTLADVLTATKLIHGLRRQRVVGSTCGVPQDVPGPLQAATQTYVSLRYAGRPVYGPAQSAEQMRPILDLYEAAEQPCHWSMHVISPLRLEGNELDIVRAVHDRLAGLHISSMPMCGATAPLFVPGGLIVGIAEVLGAYVLARLLWPDLPVTFSIALLCMDIKRGGMVYGSPEHNLAEIARMEVNRFYGVQETATRSIRSMAKKPGVQASAERAASAVAGALAGSRMFSGAGLLSLDEVFSGLQLVIDCEIRDWAERFAAGVDFDEEALGLAAIDQVAASGEFLSHEQTLAQYQRMYWAPKLFDYGMTSAWLEGSEEDALDRARQMLHQTVEDYAYVPPQDVGRQLEMTYARLCQQLSLQVPALLRD